MKAIINSLIAATLVLLTVSPSLADGDIVRSKIDSGRTEIWTPECFVSTETGLCISMDLLKPETPKEAAIDEFLNELESWVANLRYLAPIAPRFADLEETVPYSTPLLSFFDLAPTTPKEAPVKDLSSDDFASLAPVTPKEATFED